MSFSFRNMFSQGDENASDDGNSAGSEAQPFMNPQQSTGEGNLQAMFDQSGQPIQGGDMPMMGGAGMDPRATAPASPQQQGGGGVVHQYLASELLAFIPPALAAQSGIPMERTISLELPANGSNEIRLSSICTACPQLFAVEITPLNDSIITLPPRLAAQPAVAAQVPPQNTRGMDIASMRGNSSGSPFETNPFADASQSSLHPDSTPVEVPAANPFAPTQAETPSQFGFPMSNEAGQGEPAAAFGAFGAPPQPAAPVPQPAAPALQPEPSGATPTVGFSAIGPLSDPGNGGETENSSIFPAGNPFDGAQQQQFQPGQPAPAADLPAGNPFGNGDGGGSSFGAPATESAGFAAGNPFETNDSFSTIFSEKAQEDTEVSPPSMFGVPAQPTTQATPENNLPTLDEALPPRAGDAPNPFAPLSGQPAESGNGNPFGNQVAEEEVEPQFRPPQPQQSQNQFAAPAPTQPEAGQNWGEPAAAPAPEAPAPAPAPAPPEPEQALAPSTGFEPPSFSQPEAASGQRSPFGPIAAEAPREELAAAPPAPQPEPEAESEADSFDDLSPFTAAVTAKNSFFDEISEDESATETYAAPAPAAPAPEAEQPRFDPGPAAPAAIPAIPDLPPAPQDAVVKNVELRAVFGSNENFSLETIATKTVGIDGIATCTICSGDEKAQAARAGEATMPHSQLSGLAESAAHIAKLTGVADAGAFTMHTDRGLISIFSHESVTLFVRHLSGEFDPGVREKLMLITRGVASL